MVSLFPVPHILGYLPHSVRNISVKCKCNHVISFLKSLLQGLLHVSPHFLSWHLKLFMFKPQPAFLASSQTFYKPHAGCIMFSLIPRLCRLCSFTQKIPTPLLKLFKYGSSLERCSDVCIQNPVFHPLYVYSSRFTHLLLMCSVQLLHQPLDAA